MTVMPPSASASAFIWFIMWTKNGKFRPGTDSRMVSSFWAWAGVKAASARPIAPTNTEDRFSIDIWIFLPIPIQFGGGRIL